MGGMAGRLTSLLSCLVLTRLLPHRRANLPGSWRAPACRGPSTWQFGSSVMEMSVYIVAAIAVAVFAVAVGWFVLKRYPPLRKNTEKTEDIDDDDDEA
jgi:hypothetical protein